MAAQIVSGVARSQVLFVPMLDSKTEPRSVFVARFVLLPTTRVPQRLGWCRGGDQNGFGWWGFLQLKGTTICECSSVFNSMENSKIFTSCFRNIVIPYLKRKHETSLKDRSVRIFFMLFESYYLHEL